jgi:hypothetical protein
MVMIVTQTSGPLWIQSGALFAAAANVLRRDPRKLRADAGAAHLRHRSWRPANAERLEQIIAGICRRKKRVRNHACSPLGMVLTIPDWLVAATHATRPAYSDR